MNWLVIIYICLCLGYMAIGFGVMFLFLKYAPQMYAECFPLIVWLLFWPFVTIVLTCNVLCDWSDNFVERLKWKLEEKRNERISDRS